MEISNPNFKGLLFKLVAYFTEHYLNPEKDGHCSLEENPELFLACIRTALEDKNTWKDNGTLIPKSHPLNQYENIYRAPWSATGTDKWTTKSSSAMMQTSHHSSLLVSGHHMCNTYMPPTQVPNKNVTSPSPFDSLPASLMDAIPWPTTLPAPASAVVTIQEPATPATGQKWVAVNSPKAFMASSTSQCSLRKKTRDNVDLVSDKEK